MSAMDLLGTLFSHLEAYAAPAFAVFTRISIMVLMLPGIGERFFPVRMRLITAAAFAAVVFPATSTEVIARSNEPVLLLRVFGAEAVAGFSIGFAMRLFVFALQTAGAIIAQHLSLSQIFGSTITTEAESPFASVLVFAGPCIAIMSGVHYHFAGSILSSYEILPIGTLADPASLAEWSTRKTAQMLHFALTLSAPFVVIGAIYGLALAAATRAMPQLSAAFVGAPAITFIGLLSFSVIAPLILNEWLEAYGKIAGAPLGDAP